MCVHVCLHGAGTAEKGVGVFGCVRGAAGDGVGVQAACGRAGMERDNPCVLGRRAVGKGVGTLLPCVSPDVNHCREQGVRAGSVHVLVHVGRSCSRGQGMISAVWELLGGKGTGTAALQERVCELLQVTGQEWGLWEHVGSRVGALALLCAPMQHVRHEARRHPWAVCDVIVMPLLSCAGLAALFPSTSPGFHQPDYEQQDHKLFGRCSHSNQAHSQYFWMLNTSPATQQCQFRVPPNMLPCR